MKKRIILTFIVLLPCVTYSQEFRGLNWGMSQKSVVSTESKNGFELIKSDTIPVYHVRDYMSGIPSRVNYLFDMKDQKGLFQGKIYIKYEYMTEVANALSKNYGPPTRTKTEDSGRVYHYWETPTTVITHTYLDDTIHSITYESLAYHKQKYGTPIIDRGLEFR